MNDLVVAVLAAGGGAFLGSAFALWKVKKERIWEDKRQAYREIIEALHQLKTYFTLSAEQKVLNLQTNTIEKKSKQTNSQASRMLQLDECRIEISRAVDLASLVIDYRAVGLVRTFVPMMTQQVVYFKELVQQQGIDENPILVVDFWMAQHIDVSKLLLKLKFIAHDDLNANHYSLLMRKMFSGGEDDFLHHEFKPMMSLEDWVNKWSNDESSSMLLKQKLTDMGHVASTPNDEL